MHARALAPLLALAPFSSAQEQEDALALARAALGDAPGAAQVEGRGKGMSAGVEGEVRVTLGAGGRFLVDFDSALPERMAFDGERVWTRDRTGLERPVELEEADSARLFGWVLGGHWLSASELELSALPPAEGEPPRIALALRGTPMEMTLALDAETHLPAKLVYPDSAGDVTWTFGDFRPVAGRPLPHRWSFDSGSTLDRFALQGWYESKPDAAAFRTSAARPADVSFVADADPELDLVRVASGHLLCDPLVEDESVGMFIFDTGAGAMTIDPKVADELGMAELGEVVAVGIGGRENTSFRRGTRFELGPIVLADPTYIELDLAFLEPIFGRKVAGIVGYDLLARCVAEIETRTPRVALHDPARYALAGGSWQDLALNENTPCVRARFEGEREGLFRIDTGANGTVSFHAPAVRELGLLEGRTLSASFSGGVGGTSESKAGELAWFELAGHRFGPSTVTFSLAEIGAFADRYTAGNIGQEFLAPFRMVLDYPNDRLAFVELAK